MELAMTAEVAGALATGGAVVALESTIISHGLPRPDNLRIAGGVGGGGGGGALPSGGAVLALESTIISHGLPRPDNLRIAGEIETAVRDAGAVPATIAVLDGAVRVGLDQAGLATVAGRPDVAKVSVRDLAIVLARAT